MTVQEAIKNIAIVVGNARMTGPEHDTLKQNIALVIQRCELADKLEQENQGAKELKKEGE